MAMVIFRRAALYDNDKRLRALTRNNEYSLTNVPILDISDPISDQAILTLDHIPSHGTGGTTRVVTKFHVSACPCQPTNIIFF